MKRRDFICSSGLSVATLPVIGIRPLRRVSALDTINIGVIGTGSRGCGLIPLVDKMNGVRLLACCDVLPFRLAEGVRKAEGKVESYGDYHELLARQDIDAVVIATPFSTHSEIAIDALDAGKHVYCEKTMAKGLAGIKSLVQKVESSSLIFQTGHQYHSSRLYTHIVDLIHEGKIGKVSAIECQWNRNGNWRRPVPSPEYERAINWRMYREFSGGLLAELSSHQLDFTNWILDSVPTKVMGDGGVDYWKDGRETYDNIHMLYTYPGGVRAKFTCLTSNAKDDYMIKVLGDEGTITIGYDKAWYYPEKNDDYKEVGDVDGVSGATMGWSPMKGIPIPKEHLDPSYQALLDFRDSIVNQNKPKSGIESGAKAAICVQMGLDALSSDEVVYWPKESIDF
ncbi:MAG: Gfo/Idh/MocA family oxidoreductase [Bacteroidota bacterium]